MKVYRTNNKNIFYMLFNIDNKSIELDFILTEKDNFYCDVFIQNKKGTEYKSYLTIQQYNFNKHNFVIPRNELNKYITNRQIDLIKKQIKKAYMEILKYKFKDIVNEGIAHNNWKELDEYEEYRKYVDFMRI